MHIVVKQVFTSHNLSRVDLVKSLLESDGIVCLMKNEHGAHTAGGGFGFAMAFAWPEIWVSDDDVARAENIVAELNAADEKTDELD